MKTVHVPAKQRAYDVLIGNGLLAQAGEEIAKVHKPCHCVLITDSTVDGLYRKTVEESLTKAGFRCDCFVFPAGEQSKCLTVFGQALEFCASCRLTRSDLIVALGGGVTGDLSGFTAATYLRGIEFVQIPTTLLAMVDSSVGGKTAVDLEAGKNLAGAFWQPSLVLCDPNALKTLTPDIFADGVAESIKYGFIDSAPLLASFQKGEALADMESMIEACVQMKSDIVGRDEFDKGERQLLNFGHTAGHAVERCGDFTLSHGKCVAIGMCIVTKACKKLGIGVDIAEETEALMKQYNLPTHCDFTAAQLTAAALGDKKRQGDSISLVIPTKWGRCGLHTMAAADVEAFLQAGLED